MTVNLSKSGIVDTLKSDTSKAYAKKAKSRLLTAEQNSVLQRASEGHAVDVVAFRKAATAALSLAATRAGQSMARRDWTREARHLIYWADAIIDNHIEGLPTYEVGQRSRKIEALSVEVEHANSVNQNLAADLTRVRSANEELRQERYALTQAASDERRRLVAEIEEEKAARKSLTDLANAEIDRILAVSNERDTLLAETVKERDEMAQVISYILGALGEADRARVLGYWDGVSGE